jgi:lysophospholipase L1-like esterase
MIRNRATIAQPVRLWILLALFPAASRAQTSQASAPAARTATTLPVDAAPPGSRGQIDVYLIAGQSNATGQGYLKNLPRDFKIDTSVLLFNSGRPHLNSGASPLTWRPLRQASESPDRFGPELGFGNHIHALFPERKIALIKHAHSGTNLYAQWNPGTDNNDAAHFGAQYRTFVETVDAGLKGLKTAGYVPILRGMIWVQGENDATEAAKAPPESPATRAPAEYGKNLRQLIARVREQFDAPSMVFVYCYVLPPGNEGAARDLVRAGQKAVDAASADPLSVKGAFVIPTDDLEQRYQDPATPYPNDHLHFGTAGILELGKRMAAKMGEQVTPAAKSSPPAN